MSYDTEQVRRDFPIEDIVGQAISLKKTGNEYRGLCPFHPDRNPSFQVVPHKQFATCPSCGWHGDVIKFVQDYKGIDFLEAMQMLVGDSGDSVTDQSPEAKAEREAMLEKRRKEEELERQRATQKARDIWEAAGPADPHHPYLVRKQVPPHTLRQDANGNLVIPVFDADGEIQSIQKINDKGDKLFHPGSPMASGRMMIGINMGRSILCEGYATGASIYDAIPDQVCITFSMGNMEKIAREMAAEGRPCILAADTGTSAERMAKLGQELGFPVVVPTTPTDFNDQAAADGIDSVAETFRQAMRAYSERAARIEDARKEDTGPVDLWSKPKPPDFPIGVFPHVIEQLALARGQQVGCDPSGIAVAAVVAAGAAISDNIKLKMNRHETWTERACMWAMLIGTPSTNKSAMVRAATGKIKAIDRQMMRENARKMADWQEQGGLKGSDPMPPIPRLRIEDTTMEAAQEVCKHSPSGVLSIQDELEGFFGGIEKYAGGKGGARDRTFWISAYNGGSYMVNRIGRGGAVGIEIENLSMSMIGGIQPDPIKRIMAGLTDNGLIQRFMPIVLKDGQFGEDVEIPPVAEEFDSLIETLHALKIERRGGFFLNEHLAFDDDAQEVQYRTSRFHFDYMKKLETINPMLSTHMGKFNGFYGRLCVIWHCIENAENPDGLPQRVSKDTAERVEKFLHKFLLPHSVAFYVGMLGMAMDHDKLIAVAGYILAHKLETVTMRTIGKNVRAMRKVNRAEAASVFEQLEALGWLEQGKGRADAPSWNVNPEVHLLFERQAEMEAERRAEVRRLISDMVSDDNRYH